MLMLNLSVKFPSNKQQYVLRAARCIVSIPVYKNNLDRRSARKIVIDNYTVITNKSVDAVKW